MLFYSLLSAAQALHTFKFAATEEPWPWPRNNTSQNQLLFIQSGIFFKLSLDNRYMIFFSNINWKNNWVNKHIFKCKCIKLNWQHNLCYIFTVLFNRYDNVIGNCTEAHVMQRCWDPFPLIQTQTWKHLIDIIMALNARIVQFALQRAEVLI